MKQPKKTKTILTHMSDPNVRYLELIVGLYDSKAEVYIDKNFTPNPGVAIRGFTEAINTNQPQNNLYKWPDDFEIHALGQFDPRTGLIIALPKPRVLATGKDVKVRETVN